MCGRFTLHTPQAEILQALDVAADNVALVPRYNITPSQDIPVVRAGDDGRELAMARWGLVPGWSKEARPKYSTINARVESVAEKPTYRAAFRHKRCLIPADGFYEWQKSGDQKIPYYIRLQDKTVFAFAGLWEHWEGEQEAFDSCAIITLPASGIMTTIHTRMPAIIAAHEYDAWLDKNVTDKHRILQHLGSSVSDGLVANKVSGYVNSPKHTDARCIEPLSLVS
jgi:putative SOS response-associated peptidase YedK